VVLSGFVNLLQQGNSWLFLPSAVLLGALHGLEPGHSKTMMAAFIIAIRGTLGQAVLLGLAATVSHTAVVWAIALGGLYFGRQWSTEATEPYFQVVSALCILGVAAWMLWRTWRHRAPADPAQHVHAHGAHDSHGHHDAHDHEHHAHGHTHSHDHPQDSGQHDPDPAHAAVRRIDTGHGVVRLEIAAQEMPRFRVYFESGAAWPAEQVLIETERADGSREVFTFRRAGAHLESAQEIPAPREFVARLRLGGAGHEHHTHDYDVEFLDSAHRHALRDYERLDLTAPGYQDPHELAHANDIRRRFARRDVTTAQIVVFGLTGGLIPCPASITVLLLCLQLKQFTLGATLVLAFSVGLALTMVASGAVAALGMKQAERHFRGFGDFVRTAPYVSGVIILLVGLYVGYQGLAGLT
jgi:nickel/cobalt transporter (NicO) family protein